jgi:hypothetical protein
VTLPRASAARGRDGNFNPDRAIVWRRSLTPESSIPIRDCCCSASYSVARCHTDRDLIVISEFLAPSKDHQSARWVEVDASVHSLRSVGSGLLLEKVSQQPCPSASGVAGRTERKVAYANFGSRTRYSSYWGPDHWMPGDVRKPLGNGHDQVTRDWSNVHHPG